MARVAVTGGRIAQIGQSSRNGLGAIAFIVLFLGAVALACNRDWLDNPVAIGLNQLAVAWHFASRLAAGLSFPSVEGIIVVSLIWGCWFSAADPKARARLVSGLIAAVLAGGVAYLVHRVFPAGPKPILDPALGLHPPGVMGNVDALNPVALANSGSFPSERATLFAGLAIAVFVVRPRLGRLAIAGTMLVEASRIWLGLHYPSDIIGSFCLAGAMICLGQMRWGALAGRSLINWETASPPSFYMCASFASYEMISGFQDLRELASGIFS